MSAPPESRAVPRRGRRCCATTSTRQSTSATMQAARPNPTRRRRRRRQPQVGNRVLVVLQLSGGNDGLNTLIPSDARYRDARHTLAIPEADLVAINAAGYSLHPSLAPLAPLWNQGTVTAFEGIGMKDQSRSHFKAMDTWWSATPGASSQTGWLGRWLDATEKGKAPNPLRAVALGGGSPALVGLRSLPTVVISPAEFTLRTPRGCDAKTLTDAFLATAHAVDYRQRRLRRGATVVSRHDRRHRRVAEGAYASLGAKRDGSQRRAGRDRVVAVGGGHHRTGHRDASDPRRRRWIRHPRRSTRPPERPAR